ncbi:DUF881 domain-containing protein [Fenollaria sporofastidiosus]|uniref:DUF881 domain-containing protein n=1 Tax=Fenollaria sporofastidiosus TaxID=2811778 RepID=UPI001C003A8D|nr:DUF881 domain-containing protein [Fenollaria sporofastidiosus]
MKYKTKRIVLVIIYLLIGVFLGLYLKTGKEFFEPLSINKMKETSTKIKNLKAEIKSINEELEKQDKKLETLEKLVKNDSEFLKFLKDEKVFYEMISGDVDLEGAGIVLTITEESVDRPVKRTDVIHDSDLLRIINDLRTSGAEAISINDLRVYSRTGVKCNGPVVRLNGRTKGAPFIIKAIGNSDKLYSAIKSPGTFASILETINPIKLEIEQKEKVLVKKKIDEDKIIYSKTLTGEDKK